MGTTTAVVNGRKLSPSVWAWEQRPAKPIDKAVLWVIAHHAGNQTLSCWLKLRTIAAEASANVAKLDTTRAAVDRLARAGLMATIPLMFTASRSTTCCLYVLNVDGWLSGCVTADDVLATVNARVVAMAGDAAVDVFPARYTVHPDDRGLRIPGAMR